MHSLRYLSLLGAALICTGARAQDPASTYPGMELLEPDEANLELCHELPLVENFSDETHYDGTSVLPAGWHNTGSTIWTTANISALPAASGTYYMIAPESVQERDERAYTPFFNLQQGVTYTLSFASHQEATTYQDVTNLNTIIVRVGTQHDMDFLPVSLGSISTNNRPGEWSRHSFTFSPAVSGAYTFCFELQGTPLSGFACIDDLRITSPVNQEKVEPLFHPIGIYDVQSNALFSMGTDPTYFVNYSNNGSPISWSAGELDASITSQGHGAVVFNSSGDYEVTLLAGNDSSQESLTKSFTIRHLSEPADLMIRPFDITTAQTFGRGELPYFSSDPNGKDYVSGPNHYYSAMAEYFQVPWQAELTITKIDFLLASLRYCPTQSNKDYQGSKPFKVKFYGSNGGGGLDRKNLIAQFSMPMSEVFGTTELGAAAGENRSITLPRPVVVTGPFFLIFEYSEDLLIDAFDPNVGRTYMGMGTARHMHGKTTLFCKPYAAPLYSDIELDEWMPVSALDANMKGMSLNLRLTASYKPGYSSVISPEGLKDSPSCSLAANILRISGAEPGEQIHVFSAQGLLMATAKAAEEGISIDASLWPAGIYVVKVGNDAFRIIK